MKFVCVFLSRQLWNMHNSTTVNKNLHRVSTLTLNLFSFSTTRSWFSFMMFWHWIFYFVDIINITLWLRLFLKWVKLCCDVYIWEIKIRQIKPLDGFLCFSTLFFFFFFWELWRTGKTFLLQEHEGATEPLERGSLLKCSHSKVSF